MSLSHDEVVMRDFSQSVASKSSKGKLIAISIIVALVLGGAIIGCLFGLKVIGGSSSSPNDGANAHNGGDLGSTDPSSSGTADAIGGSSDSSSASTGVVSSTTDSSTGVTTASSTGVTTSSTGSASSTSTNTGSTSSSSSTGSSLPPIPSKLTYGTYYNPFAADSPWNSRPLDPVFDNYVIPPDAYYPSISDGAFSTQIFYATASDPPLTVFPGPKGLGNPDNTGGYSSRVVIPHWPAAAKGASGADGHCDIYDATSGMIHSFWQLRHNTTTDIWTAALYSWCHISGSGWGDPAHFYQGPRATGVSSGAGLIRSHEVNDNLPYFRHALTMSLTFSGLSRDPIYVFPATQADDTASSTNYGLIPEGSLIMLPPSFNVAKLTSIRLRKVAETLKRYGAYVTDRNTGTPFALYVENGGPKYNLSDGWDNTIAAELQWIRQSMRRVIGATKWVDGYDQPRAPLVPGRPNQLSMRGPWVKDFGPGNDCYFDTWRQAVVFPYGNATRTQCSANNGYGLPRFLWIGMAANTSYTFSVHTKGDALLSMQIVSAGKVIDQSGFLSDGGSWTFKWPASGGYAFIQARSGINVSSEAYGEIHAVEDVPYDMTKGKFVPPAPPSPAAATPFPDPVGLPKLNFGTYLTPFLPESPWNSRPLNPVLEAPLVPLDMYYPSIQNGSFSTQIFYATAADPPNTVYQAPQGLAVPDIGGYSIIKLAHWPSATAGATGADGHCDIYDETSGKIHSFWQLRHNTTTDVWTAVLYSWTHINGTGWGDPAHYYQGPRATGISSGAGLIRNHEVDDGLPFFRHALTMSLTYSGLSGSVESGGLPYVFPATSADDPQTQARNYGHIPEGALLMLPPTFNVTKITSWPLRKVAETLKRYGAYVTDRNDGTPFAIYVENGGNGFKLSNVSGWDNTVANEVQAIRASLSRVLSATQWIDGNGKPRAPLAPGTPNLLSMRGPWNKQYGPGRGDFDTQTQSVVFPLSNATVTSIAATNGRGFASLAWAKMVVGAPMIYTVHATGGATLDLQLVQNGKVINSSTPIGDGKSWAFTWPVGGAYMFLYAYSGINQPSSVWCDLRWVSPQPFNFSSGSYYPYP